MNTLLVIIGELLFIALVIILLYQLKPKISLVPLYIFIGSNQYSQHFLSGTIFVRIFGEFAVSTGSVIIFCSSLFAILLIYIKEGIPQTRTLIFGIVFSNVTLTILAAMSSFQLETSEVIVRSPGSAQELFNINYRIFLTGTIALILDSFLIVILYEFLVSKTKILKLFGGILATLLAVLYFDSILFSVGSFYGSPRFQNVLISQLIGKTFAGVFFAIVLYLFLIYSNGGKGSSFKTLSGQKQDVFSILTYRDRFEGLYAGGTDFEKHLTDQLVNTLETMSDGFISLDKKWKYTYLNKETADFLNQKAVNLIGKNIWKKFPEMVGRPFYINCHKAVETGKQMEFEEFNETIEKWFYYRLIPSENGLSVFFEDITEAKESEFAIQLVQRRNEALLNAMPDLMFIINREGVFTDFHNPHHRTTLVPPDSYIGVSVKSLLPAEVAGETIINIEKTLRTGEIVEHYYQLEYPEGLRFFEARYVKNSESDVLTVVRDITVEKETEIAFQESESKYRLLIEQASDGILVHNSEGKILEFNFAAAEYSGYTREEFEKLTIFDLLFPEDLEELPIPFERLKNGETTGTIRRVKKKDGSEIMMEVRSRMNDKGNVIAIVRDITERLRAEAELEIYRNNLELLVNERTKELEIEKIKAQSADKLKSAFLATMSHELRTPLNSIIGFTGILLKEIAGPMNDEQKKQLGMVRNSGRHLLSLINDILDLSKIEAGELTFANESFDFVKTVEKVTALIKPMAEEKGLNLVVNTSLPEINLVSDERRVEQILLNLLGNAVKFTNQGSIKIDCRLNRKMLITNIKDTGIGIREEDIDKLFVPFSQIDSGLTRNHEGTGLGLSISKKLVKKLGGSISVKSEFGKGSTFVVSVPLDNDSEKQK